MRTNTLLILDDDSHDASLIAHEAQHLGFEVRVLDDAKLFMDAFLAWKPTHLAIDIVMPSINGIEILKTLAQLDCQSSIILSSGIGSDLLPAAQLVAIEHNLNIRGILYQPFHQHILKNLLTDQVSVDLHARSASDASMQPFTVDAQSIDDAIRNQQFSLFYQPQIELHSGRVIGFEGLLRWQHPTLGIKLPEAFIPVAEKTGQIDQLTQIVIEHGFNFIRSLSNTLTFSLNISAKSIKNHLLTDALVEASQSLEVAPERVILELTETATMQDPDEAQHILSQLRAEGFKLSIDDFGTGYSSMAQLAKLPFTELKIDKSFVTTMETSSKSRKVVASTLKLAESLGLETIAEGVENTLAAIGLRELGCRYGQGYYFARPMDQATATTWLGQWNHQF
ncbi:EAL domain-containing response regulator [Methylophilus sp.]|jgi:EAL domain-containing protein (putative c-di-GMP-specific phosphodiesterase class I)|uniref:EAL domain-containing response regulator n=1 Tax=Methylophilus sp. TaxID=29541 RepID=UPI0011D3A5D4|nr:EAL domain-containing response regulator [Methylophilus sp.]TXI46451.1 MAG: EAL domain-containing protein [Methylophilus sp.]